MRGNTSSPTVFLIKRVTGQERKVGLRLPGGFLSALSGSGVTLLKTQDGLPTSEPGERGFQSKLVDKMR